MVKTLKTVRLFLFGEQKETTRKHPISVLEAGLVVVTTVRTVAFAEKL